jgi:PTH1 family peptidyl-tRNA hydrolase
MQPLPFRLLVGLSNPGKEYQETRHNIGFMVVEALLRELPGWGALHPRHHADSFIWEGRFAGRSLWLQQPLTYMNLCGPAVAKLAREAGVTPAEILVAYDDLDLPFGRLRLRSAGSSGGHRGVESLIGALGSAAFGRLRLGISRPAEGAETVDYVLSPFTGTEREALPGILKNGAEALQLTLRRGLAAAMNQFNRDPLAPAAGNPVEEPEP